MAHARHAPTIAPLPQVAPSARPVHESSPAASTIAAAPRPTRRSTFSRNTIHAMPSVKTPSRLRRSDADDAGVTDRPAISSKGPSTPPVRMIASSQGHSSRRTGASRVIRKVRRTSITTNRPRPEPRFSNPARSVGAMSRWSAFAIGVLMPNSTAEATANGMPGHLCDELGTLTRKGYSPGARIVLNQQCVSRPDH